MFARGVERDKPALSLPVTAPLVEKTPPTARAESVGVRSYGTQPASDELPLLGPEED